MPYALLLLVAFEPAAAQQISSETSHTDDPAVAFDVLEDRLLNAHRVRLAFHVIAEGAVQAELSGDLEVTAGGEILLTAAGDFVGQPMELVLQSDGARYEFGNGTGRTTAQTPPHLKEALLLGLTRMGLLHNLARLTANAPPDHADVGVREWVTLSSFASDRTDPVNAPIPETFRHGISFELTVAEQRAGSAVLEIDAHGRPVIRRQTVEFPAGRMRVVERYSSVTIEP